MPMLMTADIRLRGDKAESTARVLFDTGASFSFVQRDLAARIATITPLPHPMQFTLGDGSSLEIRDAATLQLAIGGQAVLDTFMVLDGNGVEEVVLGAATMRKFGLKIDLEHSAIFYELKANERKESPVNDTLKQLFARLNLPIDEAMSDEDAITKIVSLLPQTAPQVALIASKGILATLGLPESATEPQVQGKILALTHRADVIPAAEYNALKAQLHERDKRDAIIAALNDGKITPAEKATWEAKLTSGDISLETFAAFIAERPRIVPIGVTLPKEEPRTAAALRLDEVQAQINKQLGLTPEAFAKYAA